MGREGGKGKNYRRTKAGTRKRREGDCGEEAEGQRENLPLMKENRHKAPNVLSRPWPGRQKREEPVRGRARE